MSSSKFNAGIASTYRVDRILQIINQCKNNLSAYNLDSQEWNYNLYRININSLFSEISPWLKKNELKMCMAIKRAIDNMMDTYHIHEDVRKKTGRVKELQEDKLKIFERAMFEYELLVRKLGVKYDVIAASKDENLNGL